MSHLASGRGRVGLEDAGRRNHPPAGATLKSSSSVKRLPYCPALKWYFHLQVAPSSRNRTGWILTIGTSGSSGISCTSGAARRWIGIDGRRKEPAGCSYGSITVRAWKRRRWLQRRRHPSLTGGRYKNKIKISPDVIHHTHTPIDGSTV